METVLWAGAVIGAVLGLAHGVYLYRRMVATGPASMPSIGLRRIRAFYYAVAALVLWVLVGTYVLVLWGISLIPYGIKRLVRP